MPRDTTDKKNGELLETQRQLKPNHLQAAANNEYGNSPTDGQEGGLRTQGLDVGPAVPGGALGKLVLDEAEVKLFDGMR